jgi:hypothetical protein
MTDNIDTVKKNMETLIDASKEVGLEVNTEKTIFFIWFVRLLALWPLLAYCASFR